MRRAAVRSTGGAATFAQTLDVVADGRGGAGATVNSALSGATGSGGAGGAGAGGTASLAAGDATILGAGGSIAVTGATTVSAAGKGGDGGNGGTGTGGAVALNARNGSLNGAGLTVRASGVGGSAANGGIGGAGTGGNADVISLAAAEGGATVSFAGTLIDARGSGGAGSTPFLFPDPGGAGGSGTGGQARALALSGATYGITVRGRDGVVLGNLAAARDIVLLSPRAITSGSLTAREIAVLGGGAQSMGAITALGRVLLADYKMFAIGGNPLGEYNLDAVLSAPTLPAGGSITITGAINAGALTAASIGDIAARGVTATRSLLVDAGGTVRLGGLWHSPSIELRANDLDMPAGSGLNAGLSGVTTLISRNAAGMRIGDGLDGSVLPSSAFTIDNAEWSRINSGSVRVFARDIAGPVDLLIGKLDMTGPDAGSTIDDLLSTVRFTTGGTVAGAPSGTIRLAGALRATGFRASNALVFRTGQFQLAADTASLTMLGKGDTATGTLRIEARDIHVAATPLLAQLAADPSFAGVEPALDRVGAGSSGPVLRAGALDFTVGRSFYIQRTGNGLDPLGFEEPLDGFKVARAGADPIAVIINGMFRTATGLVSGARAWQQFKNSGFDFSGFTVDSRLNGCLLTAISCGLDPRQLPDPGIRTVFEGVGKPLIGDTPQGPETREPQSGSALLPPPLLLPVQPDALPGEVDEPIVGSGNPALTGGSVPEGARP